MIVRKLIELPPLQSPHHTSLFYLLHLLGSIPGFVPEHIRTIVIPHPPPPPPPPPLPPLYKRQKSKNTIFFLRIHGNPRRQKNLASLIAPYFGGSRGILKNGTRQYPITFFFKRGGGVWAISVQETEWNMNFF